ncbi:MAG: SoxR reducing system RseC family protein [Deltaproteobacteria bacterium]|nr:SoxR reducing system RseC family protein [Deltaproteobacteria bacterium]
MKTIGRVVRRTDATAWVRICHSAFCAGCGHHSPDDEIAEVEAGNPVGAEVGQHVVLDSDDKRMLWVMLLVFWLPVLSAGLLAWAGWHAALVLELSSLAVSAACGLLGLIGAGALIYRVEKSSPAGKGLTIISVLWESHPATAGISSTENDGRAASQQLETLDPTAVAAPASHKERS